MEKFIVWYSNGTDKFSKEFTLDDLISQLHYDEICDSPLLKDYKVIEIRQCVGLSDINNNKIYADCSICKVNYFSSSDWISDYCYFSFDTENLRYTVCLINEKEIVDFEASYFDCFEIIDTIQENKLGLIK